MPPADTSLDSTGIRTAIGRARWSVIQAGLITTGLALFGVFGIASRLMDSHVVSLYVMGWFPAGALLLGIIAGSGYLLAAWWFGVAVGARMLACILLIQFAGYLAAQYTEFQTRGIVNRRTGEIVSFSQYFTYTTENWTPDPMSAQRRHIGDWGYLIRAGEAALFCLGGVGAGVALVGKPRCSTCRGLLQRRCIGSIRADTQASAILERLQEFAQAGNMPAFRTLLARNAPAAPPAEGNHHAIRLELVACAVCGSGYIEPIEPSAGAKPSADPASRITVDPSFAAELTAPETGTPI